MCAARGLTSAVRPVSHCSRGGAAASLFSTELVKSAGAADASADSAERAKRENFILCVA